jgi:DNA repair protein RecN (Recombination protein N)
MLKTLDIKDYAIIEHLRIDLKDGFCVMTGETGAGKSIIMGALGMVMGEKAEAKSVRNGAKKSVV